MFGFFRKKDQSKKKKNSYAGVKYGPFLIRVPEDWECVHDNGKLRANKNDEIRLTVSMRDMTQVPAYSIEEILQLMKKGYISSDFNWGTYSEVSKKGNYVYQTLEYLDDPRFMLAVMDKKVGRKNIVLMISFGGNSAAELKKYEAVLYDILENMETL